MNRSEKKVAPTDEDFYNMVCGCIEDRYDHVPKQLLFAAVVGLMQAIFEVSEKDLEIKEKFISFGLTDSAAGQCLRGCLAAFIQASIIREAQEEGHA